MDYNKRKDNNEDDLVEHLHRLGFSVERLYYVGRGVPDLLIGGEMPCPFCDHEFWQEKIVEIKQEGRGLRPNQARWWGKWRPHGEATIAHNREDLNRIVGRPAAPVVWFDEQSEEDADQERGTARSGQDARNPDDRRARRVSRQSGPSGLSNSGNPGAQ